MKRNPDRDIIMFHNDIDYVEGTNIDNKKDLCVTSVKGPICDYSKDSIGSNCCKNCPFCYGIKLRQWLNNTTGTTCSNGYVKCSKDNNTILNKVKCFLWRILGKKVIVKNLENE